jgi:regulator of sirC expression with transglutaminase-like and TPR domain
MPSAGQRTAMVKLLADEDPTVFRAVRSTIVSCGPAAVEWLRPHALSNNPVLRRRARDIIDHFGRQEADVEFLGFCLKPGREFDLETGAWLLAATAHPGINIDAYRAWMDDYAGELMPRIHATGRIGEVIGAINQFLFDDLGFVGGQESVIDPINSYLNRVIDMRAGDPVSLCVVYLLLARRLRLPVTGIDLPGHFICRYQSSSDEAYIDVFHRGRMLTKADCIHYLLHGEHVMPGDFLSPVSARQVLRRICENVHQAYVHLGLSGEATRLQRYLVALGGAVP